MISHVFSASSILQLETRIEEFKLGGFNPRIAFVFCAEAFDADEILEVFRKYGIEVFGASTAGEISNGKSFHGTISVQLMDISPETFSINIFDRNTSSSFQAGKEAGTWACTIFDNPTLLVSSSGWDADGDQLIEGIKCGAGNSVQVSGGFAGNDVHQDRDTLAFGTPGITNRGLVCLVFDQEKIKLSGITVGGWKGIGTKKTITRSLGNIVFEIDDQPVIEVYKKYLEVESSLDISRSNETGLLVERPDGSAVMRAAFLVNDDKSILYAGSMPEGAKIRFCISSSQEVLTQTIEQLKEFQKKVPDADAGILFSCISRLQTVGSLVEKETMSISDLWKIPYNGFFSFGEFGPGSTGLSDFHNFTLSLVLIKEN
ncbi:MAG: FIST C-terminal domain-containing protein [Cyclobacteriaceae bacterium]|nr:FIST C-terminal domain-containing protein [Cyclobacteriaceae bacterium]